MNKVLFDHAQERQSLEWAKQIGQQAAQNALPPAEAQSQLLGILARLRARNRQDSLESKIRTHHLIRA